MRSSMMLVTLVLLRTAAAQGQGVLSGTVREDSSGRALAGVEVVVEGTKLKATTDNAGRYVLGGLPTGARVALFRSIGYRPVRMRLNLLKGDTTQADAVLVKEKAQQLDPLTVTGTPAAPRGMGLETFEERREKGFGKFIDSTALRRYQDLRLADVLRREGITLSRLQDPRVSPMYPRYIMVAVNLHRRTPNGEPCAMQVILDGMVVYSSFRDKGVLVDLSEFLAGSLAAVEVYRSSAETPQQFTGAGDECGTVVIWTRRGR